MGRHFFLFDLKCNSKSSCCIVFSSSFPSYFHFLFFIAFLGLIPNTLPKFLPVLSLFFFFFFVRFHSRPSYALSLSHVLVYYYLDSYMGAVIIRFISSLVCCRMCACVVMLRYISLHDFYSYPNYPNSA